MADDELIFLTEDAAGKVGEEAAAEVTSDFAPISEGAVADDGTFGVKIIAPGWGSSGYYSPELLRRDIPVAFPVGTQMFWNHQTADEERSRPVGDLRNLAAALVTDPAWDESNQHGPGMYARAKAFGEFKASIDELAPHIGVSIRAMGRSKTGEADGRKGRIITSLDSGKSVDFVTRPGAGGRIVELFESAASGAPATPPKEEAQRMDELSKAKERIAELEAEAKKKAEADAARSAEAETLRTENDGLKAELAKLREAAVLAEARAIVEEAVGAAKLPDVTKKRLTESLAGNPPVKDGAIDRAAYDEAIKAAVEAAAVEVAAIVKSPVSGMGSSSGSDSAGRTALREAMKQRFLSQGKSEEEAGRLADLAATGR